MDPCRTSLWKDRQEEFFIQWALYENCFKEEFDFFGMTSGAIGGPYVNSSYHVLFGKKEGGFGEGALFYYSQLCF